MEGCHVAINSRNQEKLDQAAEMLAGVEGIHPAGRRVVAFAGDVSEPNIPQELVEKTVGALGGLDLLVTNAGGPPPGKFEAIDDDTWSKAIDLSLMSHVRLIRAALPALRQSEVASVLAVTSYSVKQPIPNLLLSNSVRAATVGLIKTLALELGAEGIRFNSILPAWTETERVYELMSNRAKANGITVDQVIALQARDSAIGRMCTPEEFANPAVFLLSPAASYITGVMLSVDGGLYKGTL
jgi:3-oxoacyl-[acyl-carrier protein] reductase